MVQLVSRFQRSPDVGELSRRARFGVLAICSLSLLIIGLDVSIVNVALPSIGHDLDASISGLQWSIDAYSLVLASLLILSGSIGDRLGRKRIFLTGLIIFGVGSLLCSVAPTLGALIAFRVVQGVGASMLNPIAVSIITNTFTVPRERAQAIGVWGSVFGISTALGPVVGGVLVDGLGWRSIFWINIPVVLVAVVLTLRFIPESRAPNPRRPDPVGQVLVFALLAGLIFAIIEVPERGWSSPVIVAMFCVAAAALVGLLFAERHHTEPLIDLRFFRSVPFAGAAVAALAGSAALSGLLFLNTLYLQDARGLSPLHAGLYLLPLAATAVVVPPIAGRIVGRRGARIPLLLAGATMTAACTMLAQLTITTPDWYLFLAYALFGAGFGFLNPPVTHAAVSGMPRAQAGVAGAIASTSRQVGQTLGVAVVGALVAADIGVNALRSATGRARFVGASHSAWWALVGCSVTVLILALLVTSMWAKNTAIATANNLNPEFLGSARA